MILTFHCSTFSVIVFHYQNVDLSEYGEQKRISKLKRFLVWPYNKHLINRG